MIGDVARRINAIDARLAALVNPYAVLDANPAPFEKIHRWLDPDPDDGEVAFDAHRPFCDDRFDTSSALEGADRVLEDVRTP